jgi:hypothetical protein
MSRVEESCREWVDQKMNYCSERAQFILWGKLFPPDALGPRCYDHAAVHLRGDMSAHNIEQTAVYDLRPVYRLQDCEPLMIERRQEQSDELRDAVREALLTIQLWDEGSFQRGKSDADTIREIQRILEAIDA